MGRLPEFSPLVAPDAYCSNCGKLMKKTVEMDKQGRAVKVIYTCANEETGCGYFVEQDQRLSGMHHRLQ